MSNPNDKKSNSKSSLSPQGGIRRAAGKREFPHQLVLTENTPLKSAFEYLLFVCCPEGSNFEEFCENCGVPDELWRALYNPKSNPLEAYGELFIALGKAYLKVADEVSTSSHDAPEDDGEYSFDDNDGSIDGYTLEDEIEEMNKLTPDNILDFQKYTNSDQ